MVEGARDRAVTRRPSLDRSSCERPIITLRARKRFEEEEEEGEAAVSPPLAGYLFSSSE